VGEDWIGLTISKNFMDQDWIGFNFIGSGLGLKFHSPLVSGARPTLQFARGKPHRPVVPKVGGTAPLGWWETLVGRWSRNGRLRGGEADMGGWGR